MILEGYDRWKTGGDRRRVTYEWHCPDCDHCFEQEVVIEYGLIATEVCCPECQSEEVEGL